jgi:ATP-dependent DNA helicase RecQ
MNAHAPAENSAVYDTLRTVFGFESFRPNQETIINNILKQQDVFAVMPTGGGKSLCYQLPALLLEGTAVVISPLISLMKDQVDAARENGIAAVFMNSSLDQREMANIERKLKADQVKLLYIAPERFAMPQFIETLRGIPLSLFAIDEAHCISEWGHDFRPDYLALSAIPELFPHVPVAAFTATATQKVQQDIIRKIGLRTPHTVRATFNRPNLFYQVKSKAGVEQQLLEFLKGSRGRIGDHLPDNAGLGHGNSGVPCIPRNQGAPLPCRFVGGRTREEPGGVQQG